MTDETLFTFTLDILEKISDAVINTEGVNFVDEDSLSDEDLELFEELSHEGMLMSRDYDALQQVIGAAVASALWHKINELSKGNEELREKLLKEAVEIEIR